MKVRLLAVTGRISGRSGGPVTVTAIIAGSRMILEYPSLEQAAREFPFGGVLRNAQ